MHFVNKEGATVLARFYATSIKSSGERLVQAIFQDITREKEILQNLERSASDLARLNRMKDSFLGLASHELKTPLTVIMGYSELITSDMATRSIRRSSKWSRIFPMLPPVWTTSSRTWWTSR